MGLLEFPAAMRGGGSQASLSPVQRQSAATLEMLFDKGVPGAMAVIDDWILTGQPRGVAPNAPSCTCGLRCRRPSPGSTGDQALCGEYLDRSTLGVAGPLCTVGQSVGIRGAIPGFPAYRSGSARTRADCNTGPLEALVPRGPVRQGCVISRMA